MGEGMEELRRIALEEMKRIEDAPGGSLFLEAWLVHLRIMNLAQEDIRLAQCIAEAVAEMFADLPRFLEGQVPTQLILEELAEVTARAWERGDGG